MWQLIGINESFLEVTNHESATHLRAEAHTLKFKALLHRSACRQWLFTQTTCDVHVLSCLNFQLMGPLF